MGEETLWIESDLWNESDPWGTTASDETQSSSSPIPGILAAEFVPLATAGFFQPEGIDMTTEFITGDARSRQLQLTINGQPFPIPETAIVKAQIVNSSKTKVLSASQATATGTRVGEEWATSLIVIKFRREDTSGINVTSTKGLRALVEVQVTIDPEGDAEDYTFYIPIVLVRGNLA